MAVRCELKEYNTLKKQIKALERAPAKVMNSMTNEEKKRVPGWVEVTKEYGIKKSEITGQKIGSVRAEGSKVSEVRVVYKGRALTPTHFNMSPKSPNPGGAYTLKATIVKGQRTSLDQSKWNEKASMPSKCCSTEKSFSAWLYRKKPRCQGKNWN